MRKLAATVVCLITLWPFSARAAAPQFDLVCVGARGSHQEFRFDLAEKKWCEGQCSSVWPITAVSDSTIKFETHSLDGKNDWTIGINRYTSEFVIVHSEGYSLADSGKCMPKPFSGFPARRF
jgi:hypothetical protein